MLHSNQHWIVQFHQPVKNPFCRCFFLQRSFPFLVFNSRQLKQLYLNNKFHFLLSMNISNVYLALRKVLSIRNYFIMFLLSSIVIFSVYLLLPVVIVHESLNIYLIATSNYEMILTALLSLGLGALLTLQVFVWLNIGKAKIKESVGGVAALISSLASGIVATASCSLCLSALISLLGSGGIFLLYGHRLEILLVSFLLLLISLYYISQRINVDGKSTGICKECSIEI